MTLEEAKIKLLEKTIGPFLHMSVDEAINFAIHLESIKKGIGPFDPAYLHYCQKQIDWENAASLLERRKLI